MPHNIDTILNQYALFENYVLNLYNISFDDESLIRFIKNVNHSFINKMITNIITTQQLSENQKKLLKTAFPNWTYHILEDISHPLQKQIFSIITDDLDS
jgi:hypothetical protein